MGEVNPRNPREFSMVGAKKKVLASHNDVRRRKI
jgi:hypothetical protein